MRESYEKLTAAPGVSGAKATRLLLETEMDTMTFISHIFVCGKCETHQQLSKYINIVSIIFVKCFVYFF